MVIENFQKEYVELKFSTKIYTKEILFEACYILLDDYYFYLDLKDDDFIVTIFQKDKNFDKEKAISLFLDELIETCAHNEQLKNTQKLREVLLEKALLPFSQTCDIDEKLKEI